MKLNDKELKNISGGLSISGALITALTKGFGFILDLGRSIGSAFRRVKTGGFCPL